MADSGPTDISYRIWIILEWLICPGPNSGFQILSKTDLNDSVEKKSSLFKDLIYLSCHMFSSSCFLNGYHNKAPTSSDLDDNGNKLWIHGTEVGVVCIACDFDVLIAFLFFGLNNLGNFSPIRYHPTFMEERSKQKITTSFINSLEFGRKAKFNFLFKWRSKKKQ